MEAATVKAAGGNASPLVVEIHKKFSIPAACLVFGLVGMPLGLTSRRSGKGSAFGLALAVIMVYYVFITAGENLAVDREDPSRHRHVGARTSSWACSARAFFTGHERVSLLLLLPLPLDEGDPVKLVTRYVSAQFLRIYALCVIGLVAALVVVELFETIDELLRHNPGWGAIASFFALRIPQHYMEVTPVAALLASIISLESSRATARSSPSEAWGSAFRGSPDRSWGWGLILSLVTIVANEMLVPYTNQKAAMIRQTVIERRPVQTVRQNKVWFRGPDQTLMHVGLISPDEDALYDVHLYQMSPEMKMLRRVDARELRWENGQWFLAGDGSIS